MRFTVRLKNDHYVDMDIDVSNRILTLISPIPNISEEDLLELSDTYHYHIRLPITEEIINPDTDQLNEEETKKFTPNTTSAVAAVLTFANIIIAEN